MYTNTKPKNPTVVADITLEPAEIAGWLSSLDLGMVDFKVLNPQGPGGGWPEVAFTGTRRELLELARQGLGMELADVRDVYPQIFAEAI